MTEFTRFLGTVRLKLFARSFSDKLSYYPNPLRKLIGTSGRVCKNSGTQFLLCTVAEADSKQGVLSRWTGFFLFIQQEVALD
jgi:hypothetical protein